MNNNIHVGHRQRLRETAKNSGISNMQQHQVLELLLTYIIPQKDVNPLAHTLIKKFGSFSGVLNANFEELTAVKGIGEKTAYFLSSMREFFFMYTKDMAKKTQTIYTTKDAVNYIKALLLHKPVEELYVICIDGNNQIKKTELISTGVVNQTSVSVRKLVEVVFSSNTHNVILCHNHPQGTSLPSPADDKLTKSVMLSLMMSGINLLDHIIIGVDDYYSYNKEGKLVTYSSDVVNMVNMQSVMQNACKYN